MRSVLCILLILAVVLVPWWFSLAAMTIAAFGQRRFFAALLPAALLDIINGGAPAGMPYLYATCVVSVALLLSIMLEAYIRDAQRLS